MNHRLGQFLVLIAVLFLGCAPTDESEKRPNILFILVDDQRNDVLGCAGHPFVKTPNVDRLASLGTRFTNAYVTTSICAASRASILTGQYESSHGYTFGKDPIRVDLGETSYPRILKSSGYHTGFIGKFGVKYEFQDSLINEMFDYFKPSPMNAPHFVLQPDSTYRHSAEVFGDFAEDFLANQSEEKPFCLSISFNSVHAVDSNLEPGNDGHYPYPESSSNLYEGLVFPEPKLSGPEIFAQHPTFLKNSLNRERFFWRWDTDEKYQTNLRAYYRMISGYDTVIGRVLFALDANGLRDNTIIIFSADNGYYMGNRGFAGKWSHYEESLRVPLIIYDPRVVKQQNTTVQQPALNIDIPATILEYAGESIPDSYEGMSLRNLVEGIETGWRNEFMIEHRMDHDKIPKYVGLRSEQYVYVNYYEQDPPYEYLHDLKKDPDQLINLALQEGYSELLKEYRSKVTDVVEK